MKGESLGGLSNVKIVVVVMVFSYDVIVMGVNVGNKCVLRYNSDVLNRVQHRIIVTECCFVFYCGFPGFPVAQMVEHGASNANIMGSIPRESKSWSNVKL